jgi:hypothetical protein
MRQMYQQPEPAKKPFMEKAGWQLIIIAASLLAGIIGTIIVGVWQGTTHIIDFSWVVLFLVIILSGIVAYFIWYNIKTKKQFQELYNKDITDIKSEVLMFKNDIRRMREEETHHWNGWAVSFSQASDKEHRERTEVLKRQCMEAIHDAELRLDVSMKNLMSQYKDAQVIAGDIIDKYREQLIYEMRRIDAIEEHFKKMTLTNDQEF